MVLLYGQLFNSTHLYGDFLSCEYTFVTIFGYDLESVGDKLLLWLWIENDLFIEDKCEEVEVVWENGNTDLSLRGHYLPHQRMDDVCVNFLFPQYCSHKFII